MQFIDLSLSLTGTAPETSPSTEAFRKLRERLAPKIEYMTHSQSVTIMAEIFGCKANDLPEGLGWASERITLGTHSGTHFDAPWHFHPCSGGAKSKTIDEVPLEWCFGDGVVLEMRWKEKGELIKASDVEKALNKINYKVKPRDIVLIMTGADKFWGTKEYFSQYPGMSREATIWLIDQGVKLVGTDGSGWDRPFSRIAAEFKMTGDRRIIWEGHYAGIEKEYCHMERLANLDKLPAYGFKVCCFPIKIEKASAAWVRPVAILYDR